MFLSWYIRNGIFRHDFAWKGININAPIPENFDSVVAVNKRAIRPDLKRSGLPWLQRID